MKYPVEAKLVSGDVNLGEESVSLKFMYCLLKLKELNPEVSIFNSNPKEFDLEYLAPKDLYAATYNAADDVNFTDFVNAYNEEKSAILGIIAVNGDENHRISFLMINDETFKREEIREDYKSRIVISVFDKYADDSVGDIISEIMDEMEKME